MDTAPLTAAANAVSGVSNLWQVLFALIVCMFSVLGVWLWRKTGESQKLIAEKESAEKARTEVRKMERDKQLAELDHKFTASIAELTKQVEEVKKALERHIETHKEKDSDVQRSINSIDTKIVKMQSDFHSIDVKLARIATILEERTLKVNELIT